jgi:squalene-hopene/tetraprenyl-beta-curcumene cyclase
MAIDARPVLLALLLQVLTPPILTAARPGEPAQRAQPAWNPKAVAKYLHERADGWLSWSGAARGQGTACLSCHTTLPIAMALPALAAALGETAPSAVEMRLIATVRKRVANWEQVVTTKPAGKDPFVPFYTNNRHPSSLGTESVLNALVLVNHDVRWAKGRLDESTRKALAHLWEQQQDSGAWLWLDFGLDPWEKDGAYLGASMAALAVGTAGKAYYEPADVAAKIVVLKKYLQSQLAKQPLHHRVWALWASSRLPGILTADDTRTMIEELLNIQEADGGWSLTKLGRHDTGKGTWKAQGGHPAGAVSDGYATGLVVLALKRAGLAANHAGLKRAVAWLLAAQQDGTWPALYLNRARDPQDHVGKFMRDAATAFAVLALTD